MKTFLGSALIGIIAATQITSAHAQGRGEGAVVIREGASIFRTSTGTEIHDANLPRGFAVGGITTTALAGTTAYELQEENDRFHIIYVTLNESGEQKSVYRLGWISRSDVSPFIYECGCKSIMDKNSCYPLTPAGFVTLQWNACFKDGMRKKLAELRNTWEQSSGSVQSTAKPNSSGVGSNEKPLTNEDVLAMVKVGLGDEVIVSKIQQSPSENLDVATETLIKLKSEGFSKLILDSMIKRVGLRK